MNATNQKHYNYVTRVRSCRWLLKANPRVSHPCIRFVCYFSQIFHRRNHERNTRRISRCFLRTTSCLRKVYCIARLLLLRSTCVYFLRFTDTTIIRYVTKRPDTYRRLTSNIEGTRRGKEKTKANRDMKIWATI